MRREVATVKRIFHRVEGASCEIIADRTWHLLRMRGCLALS